MIFLFSFTLFLAYCKETRGNLMFSLTFRFQVSAELSRHCVLSGGTQRRAFALYQTTIELTTVALQSHAVPLRQKALKRLTKLLNSTRTKEVNFSLPTLRSSSLGELRDVSVSSLNSDVLCPPTTSQYRSNSFSK